jgi:hypothetical protein
MIKTLPNPVDEVLGSAKAGLGGTFDETLKAVEAVGVLARQREIPRGLGV